MLKMLGWVLWTNAFDQNRFIQRLSLSERFNDRSSFGPRREGHFPRRGRKMKPKKWLIYFFPDEVFIMIDIEREKLLFSFLLVCFLVAQPQSESIYLQNFLSQRLPSRSLQAAAEHFRSCSPTGVNEKAVDSEGPNSLLRTMKKGSINLPTKKRSG